MGDVYYRSRAPRHQGLVYKNIRMGLYPDDWEHLEQLSGKRECSRAYLASSIVLRYLRDLKPHQIGVLPRIYYDAQGREHEEADVR